MLDIVISKKPASFLLKRAAQLLLALGVFCAISALRHGQDAIGASFPFAFISGFLWVMYLIQKNDEITAQRRLEAELLAGRFADLVPSVGAADQGVPAVYWGRADELLRAGTFRKPGGDARLTYKRSAPV